jgi:lipopolysaccharide transport system ATP-binding protein
MEHAVTVDHLVKTYEIGAKQSDSNFRESISEIFSPRAWRRSKKEIVTVLNDISFGIAKGEIVGIIGANGAGKSTVLKILSRITYPTSGHVQIEGRVSSLLEVGTGFHEELSGRENIYLNGSILGMKHAQIAARFDEIVAYSGVERFIDTPIKRFSSGMRLRLGFAVAAHLDPDVLIVDEVLAVGDAAFQRKCLQTMESLRTGGRTVLFVSHNMAAVENLCSRAIWLAGGKIRGDGPARAIIESYMAANLTTTTGGVSLSDAVGRQGSGDIRYTHIEVLDFDRNPMPILRAGARVVLRLHYRARAETQNLSFGVKIHTEMGTLVTQAATGLHDLEIPVVPPSAGHIDLGIEALNLMPARYHLSAYITTIGSPVHDIAENCLRLDVEPGQIYGSGRITDNSYGIVFFPQQWYLDGMEGVKSCA